MNMQVPLQAFDVEGAHPLREARRAQIPIAGRAGAAAITVVAHVLAIAALIAGLHQVPSLRPQEIITVHIEPMQKKPVELPPPAPTLVKPSVFTAPIPLVIMAAPAPSGAMAASPPQSVPASPVSSTGQDPHAVPSWQALLLARLQQAKRYPQQALMRRQQGITLLRFTMDQDGRVLTARIEKSSGHEALDQETLALIQRAQPLPKPPPDVDSLEFVVPVEFFLSNRK